MALSHNLAATLESLAAFPPVLEAFFRSVPPHGRHWRPLSWDGIPSERLTAVEQVWHVRDVEIEGYRVRFARTLTETTPDLPDLPGELMAQERGYAKADPELALRDFADARATTIRTIRALTETDLRRPAIFEGRTTTLAGLVHFLASHDCQHLAGLQWLLAKLEGG
jgi:DinB superfamily